MANYNNPNYLQQPQLMNGMTGQSQLQFPYGSNNMLLSNTPYNNYMGYINETLTGTLLKKVLCHEITHAAIFSYNVDLTIEQEELVADLISTYGNEIIYITNKIFSKLENLS